MPIVAVKGRGDSDARQSNEAAFFFNEANYLEKKVLSLLACGLSIRQIAQQLSISVNYTYLLTRQLRCLLFSTTTIGAVARAIQFNIIRSDGQFIPADSTLTASDRDDDGELK